MQDRSNNHLSLIQETEDALKQQDTTEGMSSLSYQNNNKIK